MIVKPFRQFVLMYPDICLLFPWIGNLKMEIRFFRFFKLVMNAYRIESGFAKVSDGCLNIGSTGTADDCARFARRKDLLLGGVAPFLRERSCKASNVG